jgi:hypothetical protein
MGSNFNQTLAGGRIHGGRAACRSIDNIEDDRALTLARTHQNVPVRLQSLDQPL